MQNQKKNIILPGNDNERHPEEAKNRNYVRNHSERI